MKVFRLLFAALLLSGVLGLGIAVADDPYEDEWEERIDDALFEDTDHS